MTDHELVTIVMTRWQYRLCWWPKAMTGHDLATKVMTGHDVWGGLCGTLSFPHFFFWISRLPIGKGTFTIRGGKMIRKLVTWTIMSLPQNPLESSFSVIVAQERKGERGKDQETTIERETDNWLVDDVEPYFRHPGARVHHPDIPPKYSAYICTSKWICI
jgi:hypothetical protein